MSKWKAKVTTTTLRPGGIPTAPKVENQDADGGSENKSDFRALVDLEDLVFAIPLKGARRRT